MFVAAVAIAACTLLAGLAGGATAKGWFGLAGAVVITVMIRKLNRKRVERIALLLGLASTIYALISVAYELADTPRHGCRTGAVSRPPGS